jgi:septal ring factor EnvC (AmiA/AmiB activator)
MADELKPNPAGSGPGWHWWNRLPTWAKWTIGIVGALLLLGIGGAIASGENEEDQLKERIEVLEERVEVSGEQADAADREVAAIEGEVDKLTAQAEDKAEQIVKDAKSEASSLESSVSSTKQELESVGDELSATESELGGAEERVAKGTITDGVWQIERDYLPGTYEAPGGGTCYWALLSSLGSGGVEGIIENGGFNKHQILTIESPYFETKSCGTWKLVE